MNLDDDLSRKVSGESAQLSLLELAFATVFTVATTAIRTRIPMNLAIRSLSRRRAGTYAGEP
ncbi:hypothetical protein [Streptomyces europaeiscabiei]|uniref:hypothetical protein n=1 Tax=Streptomyces europaeiscabiei TaxID=146819 RepID=UPI000765F435|nr:hypothetical protein [Streptomyces europaeiscabiei]MDX3668210.1 hypothetical protein [Streptomyces europaeiscabiei]MDX3708935.1 hypothetical protein [Streptomyces europaeiscabiei]MDX3864508.1 hypothetical protein [Streptomyces europaeiscabiei]MDX3871410.1 hypothetical protein [Streptomyces europaeiscabiei]